MKPRGAVSVKSVGCEGRSPYWELLGSWGSTPMPGQPRPCASGNRHSEQADTGLTGCGAEVVVPIPFPWGRCSAQVVSSPRQVQQRGPGFRVAVAAGAGAGTWLPGTASVLVPWAPPACPPQPCSDGQACRALHALASGSQTHLQPW